MSREPHLLPAVTNEIAPDWDETNPRALINLVTDVFKRNIDETRFTHPDLFDLSEQDLRDKLREQFRYDPGTTENQIRLRFWAEYDFVQMRDMPRIEMTRLITGICSIGVFYNLLRRPAAISWICCRPLSYESHIDELLNYGARKMREYMMMDPIDPISKKPNVKLMELQARLYHAAELRKLGAITQITKNFNVNHTTSGQDLEAATAEAVEKRIAELKEKQRKLTEPVKPIIDVNDV